MNQNATSYIPKSSMLFVTALMAAVIAMLEGDIIYRLYVDRMRLSTAIITHIAIFIVLGWWVYFNYIKQEDLRIPLLLWLSVTGSGVFGALTCLVTITLYYLYIKTASSFAEWLASIFPERKEAHSDVYERLKFGWDDFSEKRGVIPFRDIIALGTTNQKRMALVKMSRHFKPSFAPALLAAVNDESNPIRVQAATIISKLENEFFHVIMEMEEELEKNPEDGNLLRKIADRCDAYAYSGLLDREQQDRLRIKAIVHYKGYLEITPDDADAIFALGRLYLRCHKPQEAYSVFRKTIKLKGEVTANIVPWYMEALFNIGRITELKEFAYNNLDKIDKDNRHLLHIYEMAKLWALGIDEEQLLVIHKKSTGSG